MVLTIESVGENLKCDRSVFSGECSTVYYAVYGGSISRTVSQLAQTIFNTLTFLYEYDGHLTIAHQQIVSKEKYVYLRA